MVIMLSLFSLLFISCGGSSGGGSSLGGGTSGSDDWVKLKIDNGAEIAYTEAFSAAITCDPRVDWASNQIILQDNYLGNSNWEMTFDIMFFDDSVGTYDVTVPADGAQVVYVPNGTTYLANFVQGSGTVTVTRSDTRIEGTFDVTVDDGSNNPINLSGSFGVDSGNSLSCP